MLLIILHELGHFRVAKKTGVKVNEFGIGLPPKICTFRKDASGTNYTLNRIPLGGFCALEGEDPANPEVFYAKNSFITAKLWKKLIIIVGGVAMNVLTARVIFTLLFRHGTQPLGLSNEPTSESYLIPHLTFLQSAGFATGEIKPGVAIEKILPESLAERIGLQTGDVIMQVNVASVSMENLSSLLTQAGTASTASTLTVNTTTGSKTISFTCPDTDCKL
ncbi:MAG: site-2 protease family protein [Candidatus Peribacteria bacterium]|jgi:membrane-associated protease RseP (regulator of RpoE activity)|nr:site-2 protease family protein [Candidatus Peribacteria bacterium]